MYDVAISGNGKDVMSQVASGREVTTDANGNKLIKDDKLGTFAYNKETGAFEQIKDKDGNVPQNPLSVQVPDKVDKNNVEEVADGQQRQMDSIKLFRKKKQQTTISMPPTQDV